MAFVLHEFSDNNSLLQVLTARICDRLRLGIREGGHASMAVSGGNTPEALYRMLSQCSLPWDKIAVSLVDERWVDEDHPDSNARMVRATLIQHKAMFANLVTLKTAHMDAAVAAAELNKLHGGGILPLDLLLLGMGKDGHTASWFPESAGLSLALDANSNLLYSALWPKQSAYARISLTRSAAMAARCRFLYLTGRDKREVLEQAMQPGSEEDLPVRALLHDSSIISEIYYAPDS